MLASEELTDLRFELRRWLEDNCPPSMRTPMPSDEVPYGGQQSQAKNPDTWVWLRRAAARGLTMPTVPVEYGGAGLASAQAAVLAEEMERIRARPPLLGSGLSLLAPTLLRFGTERQKSEHLPRIGAGEVRWCQGFSEPEAGSDLASLRTRAVPDGSDFVLNGQKIWTSFATVSDWMFCLARTDINASVAQRGITMFLVDMKTSGLTVRPIRLINGDTEFCETFFDDVRVPAENVLGEVNGGWPAAKFLLNEERRATHEWSEAAFSFPLLTAWREGGRGDPALTARVVRNELDRLALDRTMARAQRLAENGDRRAERFANIIKVCNAECQQERGELMTLLRGWDGVSWEGGPDEDASRMRAWLTSRALSIAGGTTEIQLNLISRRWLGLPVS